jgi:ABC-type sugar transport system ATPase subunit
MTGGSLLKVRGLSKTFPGLRALDDIELNVAAGEIVAVVGQNGSGKSTLVKILDGFHQPDPGAVIEHGELRVIHQDLGLVGMLNTVENLDLSRRHGLGGLRPVRTRAEAERAAELTAGFGASFDVRVPVSDLTASERAVVAIARALDGWTRSDQVLVLDEPTAALHREEVGRLFEAVRRVAQRGAGIVFISHRLDEVLSLAHRIVVLRDGRKVADVPVGDVDPAALARMMTGSEVAEVQAIRLTRAQLGQRLASDPALQVRGLAGPAVRHIDLNVHVGEIVGVTGLLGSGREQLAGLIFGALAPAAGELRVAGAGFRTGRPAEAIQAGVGFVPADRRAAGAIMAMSARENLTLPRLSPLRRHFGRLDGRAERAEAGQWAERVGLRPPAPERPLELFSGGNQQKVVLAKWLRIAPRVLLLDEPTQGVDVGAKASIYELLRQAAAEGAGVLVSSSDTKELTVLCDRVLVLREGRVAAELAGDEVSESRLVMESLGLSGTTTPGETRTLAETGARELHLPEMEADGDHDR